MWAADLPRMTHKPPGRPGCGLHRGQRIGRSSVRLRRTFGSPQAFYYATRAKAMRTATYYAIGVILAIGHAHCVCADTVPCVGLRQSLAGVAFASVDQCAHSTARPIQHVAHRAGCTALVPAAKVALSLPAATLGVPLLGEFPVSGTPLFLELRSRPAVSQLLLLIGTSPRSPPS